MKRQIIGEPGGCCGVLSARTSGHPPALPCDPPIDGGSPDVLPAQISSPVKSADQRVMRALLACSSLTRGSEPSASASRGSRSIYRPMRVRRQPAACRTKRGADGLTRDVVFEHDLRALGFRHATTCQGGRQNDATGRIETARLESPRLRPHRSVDAALRHLHGIGWNIHRQVTIGESPGIGA